MITSLKETVRALKVYGNLSGLRRDEAKMVRGLLRDINDDLKSLKKLVKEDKYEYNRYNK